MTADAELSLTVSGIGEVTGDIVSWSSVSLSDALDGHASLSWTCRYPFGSVLVPAAFADVRLVNLITGLVLFEGVAVPGPTTVTRDPGWVYVSCTAASLSTIPDRSRVQADVSVPEWLDGSSIHGPKVDDMLRALLWASLADPRMASSLTMRDPDPTTLEWCVADGSGGLTFGQARGARLSGAIADMLAGVRCAPLAGGYEDHGHAVKWHPGVGWVLAVPTDAWRGSCGWTLTEAADGMPAESKWQRDDSALGSATWVSNSTWIPTPAPVVLVNDTAATNGWTVFADDWDGAGFVDISTQPLAGLSLTNIIALRWTLGGNSVEFREITTPELPADIMVGHSVTLWEPHAGSVTATVQAVDTTFLDGVEDVTPTAWPNFLDAATGLLLDGSWTLDGAQSVYRDLMLSMLPLAYWRLGEASGTTAVDQMGAFAGTYVNTPTLGAAGALTGDTDTAVTFTGATQRVLVGSPATTVVDDFTLVAWVNPSSSATSRMIAYVGSAPTNGWGLYLTTSNRIAGYAYGAVNPNLTTGGGSVLTAGAWYQAVLVRRSGTSYTYLNGALNQNGSTGLPIAPTASTTIGSAAALAYIGTGSSLDEVAIWDRALSAAEIASLYAAGTAPGLPVIPRRMRQHRLSLSGRPASLVAQLRAAGSL